MAPNEGTGPVLLLLSAKEMTFLEEEERVPGCLGSPQ